MQHEQSEPPPADSQYVSYVRHHWTNVLWSPAPPAVSLGDPSCIAEKTLLIMANAEQQKILETGVKGWNLWRACSEDQPDLTGVNFSGLDLCDADLSGVDFRRASLREANLSHANLSRADLRGANLESALAVKTNLSDAVIMGAQMADASLVCSNLLGPRFGGDGRDQDEGGDEGARHEASPRESCSVVRSSGHSITISYRSSRSA